MRSQDQLRPKYCSDPLFNIAEANVRQWQFNRFIYLVIGDSLEWTDKRPWTNKQWQQYVESSDLQTFAAYYDGSPAGYYELLRDDNADIQIAYFGLLPAFIGRGFGGALLTSAIKQAWQHHPSRVWTHTCNLDHPAALANYLARGMQVYQVISPDNP